MKRVLCLNGPNLNRLGVRQPEVYGADTLADLDARVVKWGERLGFEVTPRQTNGSAQMVEWIHEGADFDGVIINPGAFTHYAHAIADAIGSIDTPVVEVHISNVRQRDRWRRRSVVGAAAVETIFGRGFDGYRAALRHLANRSAWPAETVRYGPHPDQTLDVRLVDGATAGVVLIHGGFFLDAWGRDTVESWAVDLARSGVSVASIGYRRLESGGNPVATTADVREATEAARGIMNCGRLGLVGHSAGAHLAMWQAQEGIHDLVVGISGFYDLASAGHLGEGAVSRFDPDGLLDLMTVPPPPIPTAMVHGADDTVVPASQSRRYHDHLGEKNKLSVIDGAGHFDLLDPESAGWKTVRSHLEVAGFGG